MIVSMDIFILEGAELEQLRPICEALGWPVPIGRAAVAKEDGKIIGFVAMQLLPHLEPTWVATSHRGSGLADTLCEIAAADLEMNGVRHWMSVVRNDQSKRLAMDVLKMRPVEGAVYLK